MWKNITKLVSTQLKVQPVMKQQIRTTFMLKRRFDLMPHKMGSLPKRLRRKHFIYDLIEDTDQVKKPDMQVILTRYVEGLGDIGDLVSVRPNYAYNHLLLPGNAVYNIPENVAKYREIVSKRIEKDHSSPTAPLTVDTFSRMNLSVVMNKENAWTLKPWHVSSSFRRCGYWVPVECIELPNKTISGPNLDNEGKEFYVTVTVNNFEKVNVRCFLHHWATNPVDRLPHDHEFFNRKNECIFPEDLEILESIPARKNVVPPKEIEE